MRVLHKVEPTAEQLPILTDTEPGFRLIRGTAGSGKTTVALMRLRQLCASRSSRQSRLNLDGTVKVLVLTFNRTLRGYVKHLAIEQYSGTVDTEITTFSRWARNLCGSNPDIYDRVENRIIRLLQKAGFTANLNYLVDEVNYILGRFPPARRDEYLKVRRTGRGRAPAVTGRTRERLLNDVIHRYEEEKSRTGKVDWNDVAFEASGAPKQDYDVVVVDETQDFSANQVRAVISHLKEDHTTTFIMTLRKEYTLRRFCGKRWALNFVPTWFTHSGVITVIQKKLHDSPHLLCKTSRKRKTACCPIHQQVSAMDHFLK